MTNTVQRRVKRTVCTESFRVEHLEFRKFIFVVNSKVAGSEAKNNLIAENGHTKWNCMLDVRQ